MRGRCLLLLKTAYLRQADGNYFITCRLDAFMQLDNVGVDMLAKTFQPFVGQVADHNFRETTGFVESLYRAAEINYSGMQALSREADLVQPEVRRGFVEVSEQVAVRAALAATEDLNRRSASRTAHAARRPRRSNHRPAKGHRGHAFDAQAASKRRTCPSMMARLRRQNSGPVMSMPNRLASGAA